MYFVKMKDWSLILLRFYITFMTIREKYAFRVKYSEIWNIP